MPESSLLRHKCTYKTGREASVPIEISIEKEIDGIQIGSGESLIASGIIESLVIVMLAFAFVRRETQYT